MRIPKRYLPQQEDEAPEAATPDVDMSGVVDALNDMNRKNERMEAIIKSLSEQLLKTKVSFPLKMKIVRDDDGLISDVIVDRQPPRNLN